MRPTETLQEILDRISYRKGYVFAGVELETTSHDRAFGDIWMVRVEKPNNVDAKTGAPRHSRGRWFVTAKNPVAVARTCLVAIKNFEEHEVYEFLTLDGRHLFDPHQGETDDG